MADRHLKGRGTTLNPSGRFEKFAYDELESLNCPDQAKSIKTEVFADNSRSIIASNDSPDIPFSQSINTYRGCEHGCIYCYARPSHNYLGLSSGADFETKIFAKPNAKTLLAKALSASDYKCRPLALGANTDPYQPIERRLRITRAILETLDRSRHPVSIVTKSSLVIRDIDLLANMSRDDLVSVYLSVTTLEADLARKLEPRATTPALRLHAVRELAQAGVPVGIMVAPIIPALNDHEIESIIKAAADMGASSASYTIVRLPHDLKELFVDWLDTHYPHRKKRVLSLLSQLRGGALNDPRFGKRMTGEGPLAELIAKRFLAAKRRFGMAGRALPQRSDLFDPRALDQQLQLLF